MTDEEDGPGKLRKLGRFALKTSPAYLAVNAIRSPSDRGAEQSAGDSSLDEAKQRKEEAKEAEAARRAEEKALKSEKKVADKKRKSETYKGIWLDEDNGRISSSEGSGPIAGASARVENAGQISSRISATRLALMGPIGLLARKNVDKRELYLTVEGVGFSIVRKLDPKYDGVSARKFAGKVNAAASALASGSANPTALASEPVSTPERSSGDVLEQVRKLGELKDAGLLTEEEFAAKKSELLDRL